MKKGHMAGLTSSLSPSWASFSHVPCIHDDLSQRHMKSTGAWYVVQVLVGKELDPCQALRCVFGPEIMKERFVPRFATEQKIRDVWEPVRSLSLPGYIFVITKQPQELIERLRLIAEIAKLLRYGETICPLDRVDCAWIAEFTHIEDRAVPMSVGVIEGNHFLVLCGLLKGRESCIDSINCKKSPTYIELDMCG